MIWPSHHAQPFGAKLKGKMRISATNGSAIGRSSGRAREDPEQGDDEVDAEVRLEVRVRLTPTGWADRSWCERRAEARAHCVGRVGRDLPQHTPARVRRRR